jgi:hypothetical protein
MHSGYKKLVTWRKKPERSYSASHYDMYYEVESKTVYSEIQV